MKRLGIFLLIFIVAPLSARAHLYTHLTGEGGTIQYNISDLGYMGNNCVNAPGTPTQSLFALDSGDGCYTEPSTPNYTFTLAFKQGYRGSVNFVNQQDMGDACNATLSAYQSCASEQSVSACATKLAQYNNCEKPYIQPLSVGSLRIVPDSYWGHAFKMSIMFCSERTNDSPGSTCYTTNGGPTTAAYKVAINTFKAGDTFIPSLFIAKDWYQGFAFKIDPQNFIFPPVQSISIDVSNPDVPLTSATYSSIYNNTQITGQFRVGDKIYFSNLGAAVIHASDDPASSQVVSSASAIDGLSLSSGTTLASLLQAINSITTGPPMHAYVSVSSSNYLLKLFVDDPTIFEQFWQQGSPNGATNALVIMSPAQVLARGWQPATPYGHFALVLRNDGLNLSPSPLAWTGQSDVFDLGPVALEGDQLGQWMTWILRVRPCPGVPINVNDGTVLPDWPGTNLPALSTDASGTGCISTDQDGRNGKANGRISVWRNNTLVFDQGGMKVGYSLDNANNVTSTDAQGTPLTCSMGGLPTTGSDGITRCPFIYLPPNKNIQTTNPLTCYIGQPTGGKCPTVPPPHVSIPTTYFGDSDIMIYRINGAQSQTFSFADVRIADTLEEAEPQPLLRLELPELQISPYDSGQSGCPDRDADCRRGQPVVQHGPIINYDYSQTRSR